MVVVILVVVVQRAPVPQDLGCLAAIVGRGRLLATVGRVMLAVSAGCVMVKVMGRRGVLVNRGPTVGQSGVLRVLLGLTWVSSHFRQNLIGFQVQLQVLQVDAG